jgi:hypothetical protein
METRGACISSLRSASCALISCRQMMSAFCAAAQGRRPLRHAERMPLRFRVMMRNIGPCRERLSSRKAFYGLSSGIHRVCRRARRACALVSSRPRPDGFRRTFFNAGLFNNGAALGRLAEFYAKAINASGIRRRRFVRAGLQGHSAGGGDCRCPGAGRAQPAFRVQSQGGQGSRRRWQHRRCAIGGARADRRRRDFGRHLGSRIGGA